MYNLAHEKIHFNPQIFFNYIFLFLICQMLLREEKFNEKIDAHMSCEIAQKKKKKNNT